MASMVDTDNDTEEEEEDDCCPICIEPFDQEDKKFFPCPCNYRVCMFCVRRIQTEFDGRCPGCRRDFDEANFRFEDSIAGDTNARKKRDNGKSNSRVGSVSNSLNGHAGAAKKKASSGGLKASGAAGSHAKIQDRRRLANVRVIQRNLVYLIGLAPSVAREETLRRTEYFGQYGKIIKVVVKLGQTVAQNHRVPSASAYITYAKEDDAKLAIQAVDGFWLDGHMIRASYGTTKYCNMFLRGLGCNNPDCLYLHKLGDDSASFTKEEMQSIGKNQFHDMTHIYSTANNGGAKQRLGVLPPRGAVGSQWNKDKKDGQELMSSDAVTLILPQQAGESEFADPSSVAFEQKNKPSSTSSSSATAAVHAPAGLLSIPSSSTPANQPSGAATTVTPTPANAWAAIARMDKPSPATAKQPVVAPKPKTVPLTASPPAVSATFPPSSASAPGPPGGNNNSNAAKKNLATSSPPRVPKATQQVVPPGGPGASLDTISSLAPPSSSSANVSSLASSVKKVDPSAVAQPPSAAPGLAKLGAVGMSVPPNLAGPGSNFNAVASQGRAANATPPPPPPGTSPNPALAGGLPMGAATPPPMLPQQQSMSSNFGLIGTSSRAPPAVLPSNTPQSNSSTPMPPPGATMHRQGGPPGNGHGLWGNMQSPPPPGAHPSSHGPPGSRAPPSSQFPRQPGASPTSLLSSLGGIELSQYERQQGVVITAKPKATMMLAPGAGVVRRQDQPMLVAGRPGGVATSFSQLPGGQHHKLQQQRFHAPPGVSALNNPHAQHQQHSKLSLSGKGGGLAASAAQQQRMSLSQTGGGAIGEKEKEAWLRSLLPDANLSFGPSGTVVGHAQVPQHHPHHQQHPPPRNAASVLVQPPPQQQRLATPPPSYTNRLSTLPNVTPIGTVPQVSGKGLLVSSVQGGGGLSNSGKTGTGQPGGGLNSKALFGKAMSPAVAPPVGASGLARPPGVLGAPPGASGSFPNFSLKANVGNPDSVSGLVVPQASTTGTTASSEANPSTAAPPSEASEDSRRNPRGNAGGQKESTPNASAQSNKGRGASHRKSVRKDRQDRKRQNGRVG